VCSSCNFCTQTPKSPSIARSGFGGKSEEIPSLPENWTDTRETLLEGMLFSLKYLGMTLVEQPKGEELSAAAVKRIVATAKASGKKLQKVTLKVDSRTNELIENISIYRISYCTADKAHDKVFAYIAQSQQSESLECHAFLCPKRKMAQAVTLTVAQAFRLAFEFWQAAKEGELGGVAVPVLCPHCPSALPTAAALGNLLDLEEPGRSPLGSSTECPGLDNSSFGPSPSVNNNVEWVRDSWGALPCPCVCPRLAQSRTNPQDLDTGLSAQELQSAQALSPVHWSQLEPSPAEQDDLFMF
uniref:Low density lipoprotein receptor adaptor protein 1 n=1 Tax=Serinus canaria TaxID=9135 RepID=A0A8C9MX67_SERCA